MAINFPASPTTNQTYTYNGRTWTWNGVGWQATGASGLSVYTKTDFTATAAQTTFTVAYTVGFVDVYYNGSKLSITEYTATNGTSVVLGTACAVNDIVETVAWTVSTTLNPALGVATATSLAIGGATIGSNALAVTGTSTFSSTVTHSGATTLVGTLTAAAANFSGTVALTGTGGMTLTNAQSATTRIDVTNTSTNAAASAAFTLGNSTNGGRLEMFSTGATPYGILKPGFVALYQNNYAAGGLALGAQNGPIIFSAASGGGLAEAMRLDTNGNLCIGNTSTSYKCAISGILNVGTDALGSGGNGQIVLNSANSTPTTSASPVIYHRQSVGLGLASDYAISFEVNGGTSRVEAARISSSGYLGIGTSSPVFSLHVSGSSASYAALASSASGSPVGFSYTSCQYTLVNNAATSDIFRFLKSDGTVIGTNGIVGHLYFYIADSATGGNASTYIYTIFSEGNGTSNYAFTNVSSNVRGTNPVSSFSIAVDGTFSDGVKVRMTAATAGIANARVTASFFGLVTT